MTRRTRPRDLVIYALVMAAIFWGALRFVAYLAGARVPWREVVIVFWFCIAWRLGWAIWSRTVSRWGQRWVRWGRLRRRHGARVPAPVRLIPLARATLTITVFFPLFISTLLTYRFKLLDDQDPLSTFNIPFEHVRIPAPEGSTLDGWFIPERRADRTIIVCHGAGANKGNFVWFLGPLAYEGYNIVFFDFRAHGASDGRTITYGIRERADVLAVVDWLKRERPGQSRVLVGLGSSQGAMALALAAADDPRIDAVVLDSPFVSPREFLHAHLGQVPLLGRAAADYLLALISLETETNFFAASAESAVARIAPRPVMIIHGADDALMPASHSQRLYDAARGPREIWFGPGPHSNIITTDPSGYAERVFSFLERNLGLTRGKPSRLPHTTTAPG